MSSPPNNLIVAQQTRDEIISNAKKNAANIVKEAELTARTIIEDANPEVLSIKYEYERLQRDVEAYRAKVESIIRAQLRSLQNLGGKEEAESEAV